MLEKILIFFKLGYPNFWKKNNNFFEKIIVFLFLPFSFVYFLFSRICFKIKRTKRVGIPVICVGNINVGGAGKTPFVLHLVDLLKKNKVNAHVITRGYRGKLKGPIKVNLKKHSFKEVGDEALLLAKKTITWVSKNKFDGAINATLDGADLIILDDGLQNYSLHQDLKIILVDGDFGFGNKLLLPAGPLRETINNGVKKSDLLIINNKDDCLLKKSMGNKILTLHTNTKIVNFEKLKNKKVVAFAGLGRSEKFYNSLLKNNINVVKFFSYPDHYSFKEGELKKIILYAKKNNAIIASTFKDKQRINSKFKKKIIFIDIRSEIQEKGKLINILKQKNCIN